MRTLQAREKHRSLVAQSYNGERLDMATIDGDAAVGL
jgi:hypothetical protein